MSKNYIFLSLFLLLAFTANAQNEDDYSHHFGGDRLSEVDFSSEVDPNPFYKSTTFRVETESESEISLKIYNRMGYQVDEPISEIRPAGTHEIIWDPRKLKLKGGIYYVRLAAGEKYQLLKVRYIQ